MINPVELITRSQTRLARLAAIRILITGLPAGVVALGVGVSGGLIATVIWREWGYLVAPDRLALVRGAAFIAAGSAAAVTAYLAWQAWRRANDFELAARQIDALLGAHQEVLTLATLADPARPAHERRSPLFATLWQRAISYLERFDPARAFPLAPATPLKRAALCAGALALLLGLATTAALRLPGPTEMVAARLRDLAGNTPANTTGADQIAAAARDVANDLDNPRLPPQQKLAELESLKRELEKPQPQPPNGQSGAGNSKGTGNGTGAGDGSGGTGEGSGGSASDKGAGTGAGSGGQGKKGDQQRLALKNDIAKAQAKLAAEASSGKSSGAGSEDQKGSGLVPQAGDNPHPGGAQTHSHGADTIQLPEPGRLGQSLAPPSSNTTTAHKDDTGAQGDTRLGDFPKPAAYQRFYKLGDKGPPIGLKNARYVTFRLPPATAAGDGEGRTVHDAGAPAAVTPYTNAPLKEQRLVASPDEEQLLPPRYRDLIR